jgi:hypothetical protein
VEAWKVAIISSMLPSLPPLSIEKVKRETLLMGSRPIVLAVSGRKTPNAVGLLPFSENSPFSVYVRQMIDNCTLDTTGI